jgi:hypothetical protein
MCLGGFTSMTPESEHRRVTRHETLHTCGCPHEHLRSELVNRLDESKTIAYFARMGWSAATTRSNVLTPLSEASIRGTPHAQQDSIMCYQLPGSITKDGLPIIGGTDITADDAAFLAQIYPLSSVDPPPGPADQGEIVLEVTGASLAGVKVLSVRQNAEPSQLDLSTLSLQDLLSLWNLINKAILLIKDTFGTGQGAVSTRRVVLGITGNVSAAIVKSIT